MRINTRKINKIHKKNKTNKKRYIRKRKSQKKRKTRKQRGGVSRWRRLKNYMRPGIATAAPLDDSETNLSEEIPKLFNFLNELKEVGKNQYPGDHCEGVGGKANPFVREYGNCTGIIDLESGNVKKVEMNDMVSEENKKNFVESLGLGEVDCLITKSKWYSSSKITDENRKDWCKELLSFLTKDDIKKYNIIGAHHNILRGTVIKLTNWLVPRPIVDSSRGISGLKNCSCIRIIINSEGIVNVVLLYEGEVKNDSKWDYVTNKGKNKEGTNKEGTNEEGTNEEGTEYNNFDKNHKQSIYYIWKAAVDRLGPTLLSKIKSLDGQKMYIDFWRHGDALHNGEVCKIKMYDSPLTKDGIIQAKDAGIYMQDEYQHCIIGNTRFCCSPLTRTFDTVIVIMYSALYQRDENDHLKSLLKDIFEKRLNLLNTRYNSSSDMISKKASKCKPKTLKWKYTQADDDEVKNCQKQCQDKWWRNDDLTPMTPMNIINQFIKPSINNGNNGNKTGNENGNKTGNNGKNGINVNNGMGFYFFPGLPRSIHHNKS